MKYECFPESFKEILDKLTQKKKEDLKKELSIFKKEYQNWYTESLYLIKQLLPDRLDDFVKCYEREKKRKNVSYENYVIEDYLQGFFINNNFT